MPFYIFKVNLLPSSAENSCDLSIRSLVNDIKDRLVDLTDSTSLFEGKLNAIIEEATEENLDTSYKVDSEILYQVNDLFPMIKRMDLPEEVVNVEYDLNASLLGKYKSDKSLSESLKDV